MTMPAALAGGLFSSCSIRAKIQHLVDGTRASTKLRAQQGKRTHEGERHVRTDPPRHAVRRRCRRYRSARRAMAGFRRGAAGRHAGAGLVPLQGRQLRDHGRHRRRQPLQIAGRHGRQCQAGGGQRRPACRPHGTGCVRRAVQSDRRQHRAEARPHRHRHRRGGLPVDQGLERPVDDQPRLPPASTPRRSMPSSSRTITATT